MIYRILAGGEFALSLDDADQPFVRIPIPLHGAGGTLGEVMWELHLPAPAIANPRARFWFTERGWRRVGRAEAFSVLFAAHNVGFALSGMLLAALPLSVTLIAGGASAIVALVAAPALLRPSTGRFP